MNASPLWRTFFGTLPSILCALVCLALLFAFIKKPGRLLFFFFCFYLSSVFLQDGVFILSRLIQRGDDADIQLFWSVSRVIGKVRFVFLVLFAHSAYRFRATPALSAIMMTLIAAGAVIPFFVYSVFPVLIEIIVILYAFFYWLSIYILRNRLSLLPRGLGLIRAVLICSGFFLIGVILDILENIPQAGVYVSILLIDFYPLYLVCIGGVMAFWALRDIYRPVAEQEPGVPGGIDFSKLPVTKREREIIALILKGETNASIADRLFIAESTVKKHVNNLFRKLGITSRWELLKLTTGVHPKK